MQDKKVFKHTALQNISIEASTLSIFSNKQYLEYQQLDKQKDIEISCTITLNNLQINASVLLIFVVKRLK